MAYLETSTDMNYDHDLCHADDPYGVAQGVHDLAASLAAKGMVPRKSHSKVAVGDKSICDPHTKLQQKQRMLVPLCLCVHRHVCACVRASVHVCI